MSKAPKLRFKEFSGDWESKHLDKIVERVTRKNKGTISKLPLTISAQYGLVDQETFFNKTVASKNLEGYYLLENGEFAYNKSYSNGYPWGAIKRLDRYDKGVLSSLYICFRILDKANSDYIKQYFETSKWYKEVSMIAVEGARNHGLLNISVSDFFDTLHYIPSKEEQEKIAHFLSLIDDKISLQGEKVEALKDYKKGIMQNIFSRELRFKDDEGRDYPEWEERKIKDIFIVTRGVVIAKTEISESKDDKNKYPVYSSQTTNNGILGYDSSYDFEGDYLTWTTDGANAGKVFRRNGKFRCTNVCGVLVEKQETLGFANKMISEILNKETPKHVSYVGNPKLMNGVMGDIKIKVPILDEQIKISKVLDNIDLKIEKEQEKLDCLNEYKKGLLQQMFV